MNTNEHGTTDLSESTKAIVRATRPVLEEHGLAITTRMYERLFDEHPDTRALFAGTADGQAKRLAGAVLAYADGIDDIDRLLPVVTNIAKKHVAAGIADAHYGFVGSALLGAMVDVLGELDASVIVAWTEAYTYLANIFISLEKNLAESTQAA
jgi:nitric oxide dioxygenase